MAPRTKNTARRRDPAADARREALLAEMLGETAAGGCSAGCSSRPVTSSDTRTRQQRVQARQTSTSMSKKPQKPDEAAQGRTKGADWSTLPKALLVKVLWALQASARLDPQQGRYYFVGRKVYVCGEAPAGGVAEFPRPSRKLSTAELGFSPATAVVSQVCMRKEVCTPPCVDGSLRPSCVWVCVCVFAITVCVCVCLCV
jgi:hypothetical protein